MTFIKEAHDILVGQNNNMSMDKYNANRKVRLASTGLKLIDEESLADYFAEIMKEPEVEGAEEKAAYIEGRALHCLVLEGNEEYLKRYQIGGPINNTKSGDGKEYGVKSQAFQDAYFGCLKQTGKELVTTEVHNRCVAMRDAIRQHPVASKMIAQGKAEVTVFFDLHGVKCQIRLDFSSETHGIIELKSCDRLREFERTIHWKFGYLIAAGLYTAGTSQVTPGLPQLPYTFIAVEKKGIHKVGIFNVPGDVIQNYQERNEKNLIALAHAQANGSYTTGYEEVKSVEMHSVETMEL